MGSAKLQTRRGARHVAIFVILLPKQSDFFVLRN